jgi:hypothetical protein
MGEQTQPFFIVSSGRSGTQMMEKLFQTFPQVEMHHEYLCTHVQPLAVRHYLGLAALEEVVETLEALHGRAVRYSSCALWGDSSNKLSWLIKGLDTVFPQAKFIHLVRDGRKVVSSFFHKLAGECYDDQSAKILQAHVDDPRAHPEPPPEKKYWWPPPRPGTPLAQEFRGFTQFQRICFHWAEINRVILADLGELPPERRRAYKLEELVADREALRDFLNFLDLPWHDHLFQLIQRPHNVHTPRDFPLSPEQTAQFLALAGDMMAYFDYDRAPEYRVIYDVKLPPALEEGHGLG